MSTLREAAQQALESIDWLRHHLTQHHGCLHMSPTASGIPAWLNKNEAALRAALAQEQAEPVREMPSNTRYTVAVEGQALTYWDSVHDAITHAQRAVYAGVDATTRAIDDLRAGRLAEWSYGFSAVRIYPPQEQAEPVAWMESPHGAIRANPNYKCMFPSQLLHWQIPLYTTPPRCPNCASLEAQNDELDRKLAELEQIDLSRCPQCGGIADNGHDRSIPPNPYFCSKCTAELSKPIYTTPPQHQPLTEEEIDAEWHELDGEASALFKRVIRKFARAVERAHGIGEQP